MGIAVMGAIMAHQIGGQRPPLGATLSAAQEAAFKAAFMDGFQSALRVAAAIAVAGAIVAFTVVRPHEREEASTERGEAPELAA